MSPAASVHDQVALRLARADQRYTSTRRLLVSALAGAGRPLTIFDIIAAAPTMPQSTAYRNLALLEEMGVVRRVPGSGEHGLFELAEPLAGHHHHVICVNCGKVEDMFPSPRLERAVSEAVAAAVESSGYLPTEHRFDVIGLCPACR